MEAYMFHILKMNVIAAVMIVLAMLFARFAKGRYSSKWKYYMWLAVMIFLMLPFNFSAKSPVKLQISRDGTGQAGGAVSGMTGDEAEREESIQEKAAVSEKTGKQAVQEESGQPGAIFSVKQERSTIEFSSSKVSLYGVLRGMAVIWLAGILFFGTVRGLKYYFSLHSMMRWSYPADDDKLQELYFYICRKKHIRKPPRLLVCEGLPSPMLAGLRNPGIYVPTEAYGMEELEFIFSHELSHYVRKDLWYKMFMVAVTTVYWFNPALYWMQREAEKDIENLCDAKMAVNYSARERRRYGELLLKIAAAQSHVPYLSVSLSDSKQVFKDRILYMKDLKVLKEKVFPAILLTVVMAASHMLVGISVADIPVMAGNMVDFQPDDMGAANGRTDGTADGTASAGASAETVSMVPSALGNEGDAQSPEGPGATDGTAGNGANRSGIGSDASGDGANHSGIGSDYSGDASENSGNAANQSGTAADSLAGADNSGQDGNPASGDSQNGSQSGQQSPALTGEQTTIWGDGGNSAVYVYHAEDGSWYDGGGRQYYESNGAWVQAQTGSVWTEQGPENPADSAQAETFVTDESGLNSQSLYLGSDGVWQNGARGVYTDNGDGTWTGPDGEIWSAAE